MEEQIRQLQQDLRDLNEEFYRNNFSAHQDFTKYSNFTSRIKIPVVTVLPSNAEIGELIVYGGKLYVASALNTWTIVGTQS